MITTGYYKHGRVRLSLAEESKKDHLRFLIAETDGSSYSVNLHSNYFKYLKTLQQMKLCYQGQMNYHK